MNMDMRGLVFRRSNRVVLRPVLEADIPSLILWMNDPEVTHFLNAYLPVTERAEREWLEKLHTRMPKDIIFVIEVDRKPIGTTGLHHVDHRHGTAVTGTLIGEKEFWGKGYGTEAKMLLLEYAFNVLNLRKICSLVFSFNERSVRYSLKCGYREEGRRKAQYVFRGKCVDEINLAVFREDWEPLWEKFAEEHKDYLKV